MFMGQSWIMKYHMPNKAKLVPVVAYMKEAMARRVRFTPMTGSMPCTGKRTVDILDLDALGDELLGCLEQLAVVVIHDVEDLLGFHILVLVVGLTVGLDALVLLTA